MGDLVEIALAQPEQRGAIHFGIAADIVMELRAKVSPFALVHVSAAWYSAIDEDGLRAPVRLLARQIIAAFQDQDALAGRRERWASEAPPGPLPMTIRS